VDYRKNIRFWLILLSLFGAGMVKLQAQQLPQYSQYMMNKFLINPAVAGSEGYTAFNLTAREQWIGLENSPRTYAFSAQTRVLKNSFIARGASVKKKRAASKKPERILEVNEMADEEKKVEQTAEDTPAIEEKVVKHEQPINADGLKTISSRQDELDEKLDKVLKYLEDTPALRKSGYITEDGGDADKEVKSFADFLFAIKRNDVKRLSSVYGTKAAMAEGATSMRPRLVSSCVMMVVSRSLGTHFLG